jgi:A/G-specific adenine glycosylase
MPVSRAATLLLEWYAQNARELPWRSRVSPYRVWISEVMLQQTRVETVIPYYRRWMRRFPSLRSLAAARQGSVLALWEGLGYYSRGRNLHRAARLVVRDKGGRIPSDPAALRRLPGVGEYIAAAVGSIAFGRDELALDANVRRVLARLACMRLPVASAEGQARLHLIGTQHLPAGRAGDFNQALMDLGALVCVPRQPRCGDCPLSGVCGAHRRGLQNRIPVRSKPHRRPHYYSRAAVISRGDRVLLIRRPDIGLLGGLWEFPKSHQGPALPSHAAMLREFEASPVGVRQMKAASKSALIVVDHTYSHFSITVHAFLYTARAVKCRTRTLWAPVGHLSKYPMGKVDRTIARHLERWNASAGK